MLPNKTRDPSKVQPLLWSAIRQLAAGEAPWPLFAYGAPGTGKTCAALCLCDHVAGEVLYETPKALGDMAIANREALLQRVRLATLVVIDEVNELNEERATGYVSSYRTTLKCVLDRRENRPLVLLSQLSPADSASRYDDSGAAASRFGAGLPFHVAGDDRRAGVTLAYHEARIRAHYEGTIFLAPAELAAHVAAVRKGGRS